MHSFTVALKILLSVKNIRSSLPDWWKYELLLVYPTGWEQSSSTTRGLRFHPRIHQRCNRLYKYSCRHNSDLLSSISTGTVSDFRTNPHHSRQIKYTAHHEGRRHNIINKTYTKRENYSAPTTHPIFIVIKNYPNNIGDISDQEYLDREDSYTLMFFIQSSDTGIPRIPTMKVNDWIIRLNDSELGS